MMYMTRLLMASYQSHLKPGDVNVVAGASCYDEWAAAGSSMSARDPSLGYMLAL